MFWDLFQQSQIHQLQMEALDHNLSTRKVRIDHDRLTDKVHELERQIERLTLALATVTELFCERHEISNEELAAKVREIDLRDGNLDGRMSPSIQRLVKKCSSCKGINKEIRETCLYCDKTLPLESIPLPTE